MHSVALLMCVCVRVCVCVCVCVCPGSSQVVDENTVAMGFHQWLAGVTERIHQTMHYQSDGELYSLHNSCTTSLMVSSLHNSCTTSLMVS